VNFQFESEIVEAIDNEKDKKFKPDLKDKERKEEIKKLKLDYFDTRFSH